MRLPACKLINPIRVDNFATLFYCTPVDRASDSIMGLKGIHFSWLGPELFCLLLGLPGLNRLSSFASDFQRCCLAVQGYPTVTQYNVSVESLSLVPHSINRDLFVYRNCSLTNEKVIMRTEQPTQCFEPFRKTDDEVGPVKSI